MKFLLAFIGLLLSTTHLKPKPQVVAVATALPIASTTPLLTTPTPTPSSTPSAVLTQRQWNDIVYATASAKQKLDLFLPKIGNGPFPLIVFIHGGGFVEGDKASEVSNFPSILDHGYAIASINYRLAADALFPAQIQDVKAAIRFLRANANLYHIESDRIATWGASAGGTLAALAGTSGNVVKLEDFSLGNANQNSNVQAVVDWCGPINFLTVDKQFAQSGIRPGFSYNAADSPESQVLGKQITKAPDLVAEFNPESYISSDDPPFFIEHGDIDHLVPVAQSTSFAQKLTAILGDDKVTLTILKGADHSDPAFSTSKNLDKVFKFLDANLKTSGKIKADSD